MRFATNHAAELLPLPKPGSGLPGWCDAVLAPPGRGEFFNTRLWYDTVLAEALPAGTTPVLAVCGERRELVLPLLRDPSGVLQSLSTPYSLTWQPLSAPGAALTDAGARLGRLLRRERPVRLDTLDGTAPQMQEILAGLKSARLVPLPFDHFGNWWQPLAPGGWEAYLAERPPALRTTIQRKLARAARQARYEAIAAPGPALEAGIAAYEAVRAQSWKPWEPFPRFDAALMRAAAAAGLLRLGVLRDLDGRPLAAQYWVLSAGGACLLKLAHAEDARAASPGTVLTALMIRQLIEQDGVDFLDFGRGDDAYKPLWVGQRRQRIGLLLANPFSTAGLLALARQTVGRGRRQAMQWIGQARRRQG
ncbi:GNAT family N-acetyltransferase [Roseomonas marmotae]|uniref:GNAT family N-acetyltransferase n=1 Tax=Roseomonas marmotae TaxID=2768161 RepID=A0ABS3KH21_9PROT|nr:GNAT family N-acetyltransferase [Roseomonas marmotae]MBO1076765.1 GNAT family N-acetyltransferase [Roseomonas marmotae]QTI78707.1 GNAT family N-acetyltransferase [Roseomonas marmotae]